MINASIKNGWLVLDDQIMKFSEILHIGYNIPPKNLPSDYNPFIYIAFIVHGEKRSSHNIGYNKSDLDDMKKDFEYLKELITNYNPAVFPEN
jgi:hypothetical protein